MEVCRACLSTRNTMMLMDESFVNDYNSLTNLQVTLFDEMPHQVCQPCLEAVAQFIVFRDKCVTSEYTLQNTFQEMKSKQHSIKDEGTTIDINIKEETCDIDDTINYDDCFNDMLTDFNDDVNLALKNELKKEETTQNNLRKSKRSKKRIIKQESEIKAKQIKTPRKFKNEKVETKVMCGICVKSFDNQTELQIHLDKHKSNNQCEICRERFTDWPLLLSHRIKHLPPKDWRCHLCPGRLYKSDLYLEFHYRSLHNEGENPNLTCKVCSKCYKNPLRLKKHMYSMHSAKAKCVCDHCSKVLNNKAALKIHIRAHSDKKMYKCDMCDFSCKFSGGLKDHQIRKHSAIVIPCKCCRRIFASQEHFDKHTCKQQSSKICPICGLVLKPNVRLNSHMKIHDKSDKYKCDRCPAVFKNKGPLRVHLNRHDGIRPKQCEYCPAKFFSASVLIKHRRIHTGEKPYVCKICQKGFTGNHNLKVHMKVHGQNLVVKKIKEPIDDN